MLNGFSSCFLFIWEYLHLVSMKNVGHNQTHTVLLALMQRHAELIWTGWLRISLYLSHSVSICLFIYLNQTVVFKTFLDTQIHYHWNKIKKPTTLGEDFWIWCSTVIYLSITKAACSSGCHLHILCIHKYEVLLGNIKHHSQGRWKLHS